MALTPELIALGERFLPWPEGGLHFRAPDPLPNGLRLSEDCPARRILEYFEADSFDCVTAGVSLAGHLYADLFIQALLPPTVSVEWAIPWLPNDMATTRLDAVAWDGPLAAHYELKTASKKSPTPTADNRRQVIRQRGIAHMMGTKLPPTSVVFIIGKSGHLSCYVYGPFEIIPNEFEWESTLEELHLVNLVMGDILRDGVYPREHPLVHDLCRCTQCYPIPVVAGDDNLVELVDGVYSGGIDDYQFAKSWYGDIREDVRKLISPGESRDTPGGWIIKHSKKGRLTIERAGQEVQ
jgi:hypothetical protein